MKTANAVVHLNSTVKEIVKNENGLQLKLDSEETKSCDAIVLAAPLEQSNIVLPSTSASVLRREFQLTQTTFLRGTPRPEFFGKTSSIPDAIYTVEKESLLFNYIGCRTTDESQRAPFCFAFLRGLFRNKEDLRDLFKGASDRGIYERSV